MGLVYQINFIGHDAWIHSGFDPRLSQGDVITRDGEIIGTWRVLGYDPNDEYSSGLFEFSASGEGVAKFTADFAMLDVRNSRGAALSTLSRAIREWYEASNAENSQ